MVKILLENQLYEMKQSSGEFIGKSGLIECDVATALKFAKRRRHKEIVSLIEPLM